ncbi:MAG: RNA polymerase subunit sigma-70 [Austwickia sp.]|nr:RNA polymerase subunit sigma-70 [Austwickia sp.]MBK8437396.1 RNA polymerase subunit sigma-70 [Austwickia sp.]
MSIAEQFDHERLRLVRLAAGLLGDRHEAEDIVQLAWMRLDGTDQAAIRSLPAWLTTVTTRLCLDRLRARVPEPVNLAGSGSGTGDMVSGSGLDPLEEVVLADSVGVALHAVLESLSPSERVAFMLHDTFGVEFATVAGVLDCSAVAARKLASRARAKIIAQVPAGPPTDGEVVDAFMEAAKGGDFARLLHLLAPDVVVRADAAAIAMGTPELLKGRDAVAAMFDGAASAALPVFLESRTGAAWFHRGRARVVFDFTVHDGRVTSIVFRAAREAIAAVTRRKGAQPVRATRAVRSVTPEPPARSAQ